MPRDKIKILFNKNRVTITQKELNKSTEKTCVTVENRCPYHGREVIYWKNEKRNSSKETFIKCESPLGFYYNKPVYSDVVKNKSTGYRTNLSIITLYDNSRIYEIQYYTEWGDNRVGIETRPWQVCPNEKSMPDRFIGVLLKLITDFLNEVESLKYPIIESHIRYNEPDRSMSFFSLKSKLMVDMFGSINGPRFQTDEEKILSHGFDLKESFRNRKEK